MIIRILSGGQFEVNDAEVDALNALDDKVHAAINANDDIAFSAALQELVDTVRRIGGPVSDDEIRTSDAILPPADATINEARELLHADGLIPG